MLLLRFFRCTYHVESLIGGRLRSAGMHLEALTFNPNLNGSGPSLLVCDARVFLCYYLWRMITSILQEIFAVANT